VPAVTLDRRRLLLQAVHVGSIALAGSLASLVGCSRSESACYDAELLSTPDRSLRDSRHYADVSPHGGAMQCGGCQYFRTAGAEGCGSCQILGGPVSARGHCDAWVARAAG
jgi:hypothetical protein